MGRPASRLGLLALAAGLGASSLLGCPRSTEVAGPAEGSVAAEVPAAIPETEPNDDADRAHELAPGRVRGGALSDGDVDAYRLLAAPGTARVTITAAGGAEVEVGVPRDGVRWLTVAEPGVPLTLGPIARGAATVFSLRGQGEYTIVAESDPAGTACGFAREGDSPSSPGAELLALPARVEGCLATAGDEDFFVVRQEAFVGTPQFGLSVSGVEGVSLDVRLEDATGLVLAAMSGGPGRPVAVQSVAVPLEGGVVVRVRSLSGANETLPYQLELRRVPPLNGVIESEPNDVPVQATPVGALDLINGFLHRPGDLDYFRLQTQEPRVVRLFAQPPAGADLQILLDEGTLFGPATIDDAGVDGREGICSVRVGPETPFVFGVRARTANDESAEPYLVHFELYDGIDFELEPNNAAADLPQGDDLLIPPNQPVGIWLRETQLSLAASGHIFPPGDADFYAVEVFADPRSQITWTSVTVRLEPNGPSDYTLELLDDEGGVLGRSANPGPGEGESVSLDLPGGRYFARVTLNSGASCDAPYRVTVAQTEIPRTPAYVTPTAEGSGGSSIVIENAVFEVPGGAVPEAGDPATQPVPERTLRPRPPVVQPAPERPVPPAPAPDPGGGPLWPNRE